MLSGVEEVFEAISQGEYTPPALPQEEAPVEDREQGSVPQEEFIDNVPQQEAVPQQNPEEEFDYSDFNIDEQDI